MVSPGHLLTIASRLGAQIILTDTLDMIASDQDTRDDMMTATERAEYIIQPVNTPPAAHDGPSAPRYGVMPGAYGHWVTPVLR
jgi:hypothetical protein